MRAAYNMAEAVVWLHEQCTRVPVCVVGRYTYVVGRRDGVVGRRDGVVGRRDGVVGGECGIDGERLGVDVDRPVGRLDYRFVVIGCSDCEFRCSV